MQSLREQEYVLAIAKHGNISKAADELFVSQPTLSVFLRKLEESIGTPLFSRVGKQLIPTYAGTLYLNYAQEILFRQRQFQTELSSVLAEQQGRLRLGIHKKRTTYLLPYVLPRFRERYPNIEISIVESDSLEMEEMLLTNQLDLAICNRYFTSNPLQTIHLYKDHLLLVTQKDHPAASHVIATPDQRYPYLDLDFVKNELFLLQLPSQSTRAFTDRAFAYCDIKPQHRFEIESMEAAAQLAAEGYGVAFTTMSYAPYYSYTKPADHFLIGDPNDFFYVFIAYNADSHLPVYTEYFIDLVTEYFKGLS